MMHRIAVGFLLLSFALGSALSANDPPTKTDKALVIVIRDVTVISPERDAPLLHAAVVIRDGRIAQVGCFLNKNPFETITAYDAVETVFLNGDPIARFAVLAGRTDSGH